MGGEPLVQGVLAGELRGARRQAPRGDRSEVGCDPPLQRGEPQFLEPRCRHAGERLEEEVGKCRTSPQVERSPEDGRCVSCPPVDECLRTVGDECFEAVQVELVGRDLDEVARRTRHDHIRGRLRVARRLEHAP